MNYIKNHKLSSFVILVYIIVVAFAYFLYKLFIGSSGLPVYGDRLDGIENVPISEEQKKKIVEALSEPVFVLHVETPYLKGKILKVVMTVSDISDLKASKDLSTKILEILDADQKAFYDVEFFINKDYNCTLEATGNMDEEGNFIGDVDVKFVKDLSNSKYKIEYGISQTDTVNYGKGQNVKITEDGEHIVYGFVGDYVGETKCSIKIVKTTAEVAVKKTTINTVSVDRDFPTIGYMKAGTNQFVWAKTT